MYLTNRNIMQYGTKAIILVSLVLSIACNNLADKEAEISIVKSINLSADVIETSGLYCPSDDRIYTINDSGNSAVVYQLDAQGNIVQATNVDHSNVDWEAVTGDDEHLYIGDIGNNRGERADINVLVVDKNTFGKRRVLNIEYANNRAQNISLKHDFDGEALVSFEDKLILFSKSWLTNNLHVYALSKTQEQQLITPITSLEGLPGVVTGADYSARKDQFIVVGYKLNLFGLFSPFIAVLNSDFSLVKHYPLTGFSQVEGLCISPSGKIWISQEGTVLSGPKLAQITIQ